MLRISKFFRRQSFVRFSSLQSHEPPLEQESSTPTIEMQMPVFPLTRHVIQLSDRKFQEFSKIKKLNITSIVRRQSVDLLNQELIHQFYNIGTYCNVQLKQSSLQMIINGVQRVQITHLEQFKYDINEAVIKIDNDEAVTVIKEDLTDMIQEGIESIHEDDNSLSEEDEHEHLEQAISQGDQQQTIKLPMKNSTPDLDPERILQATFKFIQEPHFLLDIQLESQLKHLIDTYSKILYMNRSQLPLVNYNFADSYRIIDSLGGFLCIIKYFEKSVMQETLETIPLPHRLEKVHGLMSKYLVFLQYYSDVGQLAQQNVKAKKAQEFYNEMFKIVKGAVEGKKGKEALIEQLGKRLNLTKPPEHVKKLFLEESQRYLQLDDMSSESNMLRTYLEWITSLPYGLYCEENTDLLKAKTILDEDHYGMEEIKERILEFIAVSSLSQTTKGRILLLVGPPGTGKTSLAASIARAVGRPFARVSMGGESDVSFLKGHRRTYVGAYPGKIVQQIKMAGKENCVMLLDEIDKLGRSDMHGDPQSNLLEVLDPEQNNSFTDNYLDYPIDLSKVLFICSANSTHTIQTPLLDRMDLVELSSYTNHEKKQIYYKHLLKKAVDDSGLNEKTHNFKIEPDVIDVLIKDYCREPGVRSLEKSTRKITEKIAYRIIKQIEDQQEQQEIVVGVKDLQAILGHPKFSDFKFKTLPPGVVIGLAYTDYGGSLLFLEVTQSKFLPKGNNNLSKPVAPGLKVTGSLGEVMQESMQIAYTYAKSFSFHYLGNNFLEQNEVHIHAPEGATPKDGPSAGAAITSALLSLVLNIPIPNDLGMTGELSLNGLILPIGGCKEKILAAQREGLKRLIFPEKNRQEVMKLKSEVKEGLDIMFVTDYSDVFKILFPEVLLRETK